MYYTGHRAATSVKAEDSAAELLLSFHRVWVLASELCGTAGLGSRLPYPACPPTPTLFLHSADPMAVKANKINQKGLENTLTSQKFPQH